MSYNTDIDPPKPSKPLPNPYSLDTGTLLSAGAKKPSNTGFNTQNPSTSSQVKEQTPSQTPSYNQSDPAGGNSDKPVETTSLAEARSAHAPNANRTTTAGAPPGTDIVKASKQVKLDSILHKMYNAMQKAGSSASSVSESAQTGNISEAYYFTLKEFIVDYGYLKISTVLNNAFLNNGIKFIDDLLKPQVKKAHSKIIDDFLTLGHENFTKKTYNIITEIGPAPSNTVNVVPNLWFEEYYLFGDSPFPGYKEWRKDESLDTDIVYTLREIGENYYESSYDEVIALSVKRLYKQLKTYFVNENLTTSILNRILLNELENINDDLLEKAVGKGSKAAINNISQEILGKVANTLKSQLNTQAPRSVLNKSSTSTSIKKHAKSVAVAKNTQEKLKNSLELVPPNDQGTIDAITGPTGNVVPPVSL